MPRLTAFLLLGLLASLPLAAPAQAPSPTYRVETLAEGLDFPWSVAFLPGGRMLITERGGTLRMYERRRLLDKPVQGVPPVFASGQAGLFDVTLDPEFEQNQILYLSFAHGDQDANQARIVRARLSGYALEDVLPIFTAQPAKRGDAHYGARMAWLADGTLVMGLGDGFDYREQAQQRDSHLGKIIRIHRDGSVPTDNPFVDRQDTLPEIYSFGHRNVQGLVSDLATGRLWAHEHGPRGGDELNRIRAGHNYGWPLITYGLDYTGARVSPYTEMPGLEQPVLQWTPSIAPSGMTLYHGDLFPQWDNSLFVSTLAERSVRRIPLTQANGVLAAGEQDVLFQELGERIRDVRTGPDGALYLLTDSANGKLLRVVPADAPTSLRQ